MIVEKIKIRQFRNYVDQGIELHPNVNLFFGDNGQGKTNILEALLLALGHGGFRQGMNSDFILRDSTLRRACVELCIDLKGKKHNPKLEISLEQKAYYLNTKKAAREKLLGLFSCVLFSPDSLSIVKQGPSARRNFIDGVIYSIHRSKVSLIHDYLRCLKSRNKVLKSKAMGELSASEAEPILESLKPSFLRLATDVTYERISVFRELLPRATEVLQSLLGTGSVEMSVEYVISGKSAVDWSQNQVYDALLTRIQELRAAEYGVGQSLVGPHKHDVRFKLNGNDARFHCSQGEQRAIILALKIAQIMQYMALHEDSPVLLLDDVFSELDPEKRRNLLKILGELKAQILLTTTDVDDREMFGRSEKSVFKIEKGNVIAGWN